MNGAAPVWESTRFLNTSNFTTLTVKLEVSKKLHTLGGVVSVSQSTRRGVLSTFPALSIAANKRVWLPSASRGGRGALIETSTTTSNFLGSAVSIFVQKLELEKQFHCGTQEIGGSRTFNLSTSSIEIRSCGGGALIETSTFCILRFPGIRSEIETHRHFQNLLTDVYRWYEV